MFGQLYKFLILQKLKSDQNGVEMFTLNTLFPAQTALKSDQNGVEMSFPGSCLIQFMKLKSDQNGVEILQIRPFCDSLLD